MIFGFRMGANERSIFCKDEPHGDEAGACEAGSTPWAFLVVDCFYCTSKCGSYHSRCGHPSQGGSCPNCSRDGGRSVVKAWSRDEPFLAEEIANLPELSGESSHEGHWATLIAKSQVWRGTPSWRSRKISMPLSWRKTTCRWRWSTF
ncbi:hypothetical protein BHM03_00014002 [Ensete ventricosum]|nr:hypothetical protein BHM03_00014002 [Ensete ventricosum]